MTTIPDDYDHGADPAVRKILDVLQSHFDDMDDGEDTPFGPFGEAACEYDSNVMLVRPDQDAEHWDERDDAPEAPVVRITVEVIA